MTATGCSFKCSCKPFCNRQPPLGSIPPHTCKVAPHVSPIPSTFNLIQSRPWLLPSTSGWSAFPVHLMKPWQLPSILTLVLDDPDFLGIILDTHTSNPFFSSKAADPVALPLHTPSFLTLFSASSLELALPLHTQDSLSYCPRSFQKRPSLALGSPFFAFPWQPTMPSSSAPPALFYPHRRCPPSGNSYSPWWHVLFEIALALLPLQHMPLAGLQSQPLDLCSSRLFQPTLHEPLAISCSSIPAPHVGGHSS
ncbi:hypothetical protein L7F22_032314 [Adiantum nelumboides]|nr:hypothetical protein [Adiantum nelumboides]